MHDFKTIDPAEDYDMWESVLTAQDEQDNIFRIYLIQVKKLLQQVISKKKLDAPNENKTGHFLDTTLPNTCKRLVNQPTWQTNQQLVCQILEQSYIAIPVTIHLFEPKQVLPLLSLLNPNVPFYIETKTGFKANKARKWKDIVDSLVRKNGIDIIAQFITNNPTIIPFDAFCGYFALIYLFKDSVNMRDPIKINKPIEIFLDQLQAHSQQSRASNNDSFSHTINFFLQIALMNQNNNPECHQYIDKLIQIATEHINCDNLEKNMTGITILTEVIESIRSHSFLFDPNQILQKILEKDLHQQVVPKLTPLFMEIAKAQQLTIDLLLILWEKTKTAHFSVQILYADLLGESLGTIKEQLFNDWLYQISNSTIHKILFKVLLKCAMTANNDAVVKLSLQTIFKYVNDDEMITAIIKEYDDIKNKKIQKLSFYFIMESIRGNDGNKNLFKLLCTNIKRFKESCAFFDILQIVNYISKFPDNEDLFYIFQSVIEVKNVRIPVQAIPYLLFNPTETLWKTLNQLLNQKGMFLFDQQATVEIIKNLNQMQTLPKTSEFLQFIKNFILLVGLEMKKIEAPKQPGQVPKKFKLNSIDIPGFNFLWRAYDEELTTNNEVQNTIISLIEMIDVYSNPSVLEQILLRIKNSPLEKRERYLNLLRRFILNCEKGIILSNYGYIRHKDLVIPSVRRMTIYIMHDDNAYPIIFSSDSNPTIDIILGKFTSYYGIATKGSTLHYQNTKLVNSKQFSDYKIPNGATLFSAGFNNNYTAPTAYWPSPRIYADRNYPIFYNILHGPHTDRERETIRDLLREIPSDPNIVQKINTNIDEVLKWLEQEPNPFIANYIIECLILPSFQDQIMREFIHYNGIQIILNKIQQKEFIELVSPGFIVLSNLPIAVTTPFAETIINFVCQNLIDFQIEAKIESILFLMKLDVNSACSILMHNEDLIINTIEKLTNQPLNLFTKYLLSMNQPDFIVDLCIPQLKNNQNASHFMPLFVDSVVKSSTKKPREMLELCFNCVDRGISSDQLGNAISKLLFQAMNESKEDTNFIANVFEMVKKAKSQKTRETLLNTLLAVENTAFGEYNSMVSNFISIYANKYFDRFGFSPDSEIRSQYGAGLRNLGATCYSNSTLQQLFHLSPFVSMLFKEQLTDDAHISLRYLFSAMLISQCQYCDPEPFLTKFKAPGGGKVNFGEEQDASEFIAHLISQFPKSMQKLFTGRNRNVFENKEENQRIENTEDFITWQLSVQNSDSVPESVKQTTLPEYMMYMCENIGRQIQMERITYIDEAPPVLIVVLKRFEFDLNTFQRIKINKHIEIPEVLSIKDVMYKQDNADESEFNYKLHGMVLHTGNANSGHYYSIINTSTDETDPQWVKYNDMEVLPIKAEKAFNEATGQKQKKEGQAENRTSAYILFYVKSHATIEYDGETLTFGNVEDARKDCNPDIISRIEDNNKRFFDNQCAFTPVLLNLAHKFADPSVYAKYYLRIFLHSKMEDKVPMAEGRLLHYIDTYPDMIAQIFIDDKENINKIMTVCTTKPFTSSLTKLLKNIIEKSNPSQSFEIVSNMINCLAQSTTIWHSVPNICDVILHYIEKFDCKQISDNEHLVNSIIFAVNDIFSEERSNVFIQNVDASKLFEIIRRLATVNTTEGMVKLKSLYGRVSLSKLHTNAFQSMLNIIMKNDSFSNVLDSLSPLTSDVEIENFLDTHANVAIVFEQICKYLSENDSVAKQIFLNHPNPFLKFLIHDAIDLQKLAFKIIKSFFPSYKYEFEDLPSSEGSEEANQIINSLLDIAKKSNNQKSNYSFLCFAISFMFNNSGNISQCLSDLVCFGIFVSDKTTTKNAVDKLLPAIECLAKSKLESSYFMAFLRDEEMLLNHSEQCQNFLGLVTVIFIMNLDENDIPSILSNETTRSHLVNASKGFTQCSYNYVKRILEFLIDIKRKGLFDTTKIILDVFFIRQSLPVINHVLVTYVLIPHIEKIVGKMETLRNLRSTLTNFASQQSDSYDNPIISMLELFDNETPDNIYQLDQWRHLMNLMSNKSCKVRLLFVKTILIFYERDINSQFSQIMHALADQMNDNPLRVAFAIYEKNYDKVKEIIKGIKSDVDSVFSLLNEIKDEEKMKFIDCLPFAIYYMPQETEFWKSIIEKSSLEDLKIVCQEIVHNHIDELKSLQTLMHIKEVKNLNQEQVKSLFNEEQFHILNEKSKSISLIQQFIE